MTTDFGAGLARKWCPEHGGKSEIIPSVPYPICACAILSGAIREALEEAEKTITELEFVADEDPFQRWTTQGGSFAKQGAAALAALKGTP